MYISTRGHDKVTASKAIVNGLAKDGGLYIIEEIPSVTVDDAFVNKSYNEKAFQIFKEYLDDFTDEEISWSISKAYNKDNFKPEPVIVKDFNDFAFFDLFQGPTFAFKDVALSVLPYLMDISLKKQKNNDKLVILTATSGDTGSAALAGFKNLENASVVVLYPNGGVSYIQEQQMLSFKSKNTFPIAVNGNFDDCQRLVKEAFNKLSLPGICLSSANSINIGRLLPQIVYYFHGYSELVKRGRIRLGDKINVSVPTGNFGNILACYLSKLMGLPIDKIICASNENNVLQEFFDTGIYNANRKFHLTNSPSMDILISSNLERYLFLKTKDSAYINQIMNDLKTNGKYVNSRFDDYDFLSSSTTEEETKLSIRDVYKKYNLIIDPHSAVSYDGYVKNKYNLNGYTAVIATASPYKFSSAVCEGLEIGKTISEKEKLINLTKLSNDKLDPRLEALLSINVDKTVWAKENVLMELKMLLEGLK